MSLHLKSRHVCGKSSAHHYIQRADYLRFNFNAFAVGKYSMLAHLESKTGKYSIRRLHNAALGLLELVDPDVYTKLVSAH